MDISNFVNLFNNDELILIFDALKYYQNYPLLRASQYRIIGEILQKIKDELKK